MAIIRDAEPRDLAAILALNLESERFLSPLDAGGLRRLDAAARYHRVVDRRGTVAAFLLALREGADYDSPNYCWFAARYHAFLYVDRIVVAAADQGRGLGRQLYDDLFAFAARSSVPIVTCEVDLEPPNEPSRRFHERFGFRQVGDLWLPAAGKRVALLLAPVGALPPATP